MTPEQTFNHHMKEAIKALRRCQPAYIGKAYKGVTKAVKTVMFKEAAKLWRDGLEEAEIDRKFSFQQTVQFARAAIGHTKVPYRIGRKGGHVPTVGVYLPALKKPGDSVLFPINQYSTRNHVMNWCGVRGIRVQTRMVMTNGVRSLRVTCTRHVPYEESERKAKLATSQTVSSDMASSHDQAIQA